MFENLMKTIGKQPKVLDCLEGNNNIIDGVSECYKIRQDYKSNSEFLSYKTFQHYSTSYNCARLHVNRTRKLF